MVNDEDDQMNKHKGYLSWQVWSTVGWKENKGALPTANAVRIIVMSATTAAIFTPWTRSGFSMHAHIPRNAESDEYTVGIVTSHVPAH
jgi:hypothetical protein